MMGSGIVLQQLVPEQINAVVAQEGAATNTLGPRACTPTA